MAGGDADNYVHFIGSWILKALISWQLLLTITFYAKHMLNDSIIMKILIFVRIGRQYNLFHLNFPVNLLWALLSTFWIFFISLMGGGGENLKICTYFSYHTYSRPNFLIFMYTKLKIILQKKTMFKNHAEINILCLV